MSIYDELFVLCEKNDKENIQDAAKAKSDLLGAQGASMKNEGKKI